MQKLSIIGLLTKLFLAHHVSDYADPSLTSENVFSVLQIVTDWGTVCDVLGVPPHIQGFIKEQCHTDAEKRQAAGDWWLQYTSNPSWSWMAGRFYCWEERAAQEAVLRHIPKEIGNLTIIAYYSCSHFSNGPSLHYLGLGRCYKATFIMVIFA